MKNETTYKGVFGRGTGSEGRFLYHPVAKETREATSHLSSV